MRMELESQAAKSTSGFQGAIIITMITMILKMAMVIIIITMIITMIKMIFKVVMIVIMIRAIIGQVWSGKADSVQGPKLSNHGRYNV